MTSPAQELPLPAQDFLARSCPLCGSGASSIVAEFPELTWVRCTCGLVYKRSQRAMKEHAVDIGDTGFKPGAARRPYTTRTPRRVAKSRHQILDLLNHAAPGPLLDIGCSLGYTLTAARQLGLQATGADISQRAVDACRAMGFRAERGTLESLPFEDSSFQLVVMKHVFEHTPRPREAASEVRRVLKPGGGLFIAVPDANNRKAAKHPQSSRHYLPGVHGRQHFIDYTPATLSRLLVEEGFTVTKTHPHLVHKRATLPTKGLQAAFAPVRAVGQAVASGFGLRKEFWMVALRPESRD